MIATWRGKDTGSIINIQLKNKVHESERFSLVFDELTNISDIAYCYFWNTDVQHNATKELASMKSLHRTIGKFIFKAENIN